jgi:hypothetical protein
MVSTEKPKQIQKPIFSLQIIDEKEVGSKLKISMMPLRLNLDLDTVDFLSDFYTALSQSIAHLMPCEDLSQMHGAPVMEIPKIPKEETKRQTTPLVETTAAVPIPIPIRATKLGDQKICFNDLKSKDELNDLFSEDDVLITDSFCDQLRNQKIASDSDSDSVEIEDKHAFERSSIDDSSDAEDGGHALQRSADSIETQHADEMIATNEFNQNLLIDDQHMQKTENAIIEAIEEDPIVSDPNPTSLITQEAQPIKCPTGGSFYFKEVVFSPACPIRLDFNGKMKTGNGVIGLLMGLAHLHKTEVVLKELHNMGGFDDFERLRNVSFIVNCDQVIRVTETPI